MKNFKFLFFLTVMQFFLGHTYGAWVSPKNDSKQLLQEQKDCFETWEKKYLKRYVTESIRNLIRRKKDDKVWFIPIYANELCSIIVEECSYLKVYQRELQELLASCSYFLGELQKRDPEDRFDLVVAFAVGVIQKFHKQFEQQF